MELSIISTTLLLLVLLDPIGNIPIYIATVERLPPAKRIRVIARECLIAYAILILFVFGGNPLMSWMHLTDEAMGIAGGIILFIIALRLIFRRPEGVFGDTIDGEPFVFPLAVPLFAGPSAIAFVLLMTSKTPERTLELLLAVTIASGVSSIILILGTKISRIIGKRGLRALETLLGLLLTAVATQMLLDGIKQYLSQIGS
ncbi:MAG: NAAT family transporter [Opitutales bacterium]|nr:NAAT family transporter [Opitutales bacterium]